MRLRKGEGTVHKGKKKQEWYLESNVGFMNMVQLRCYLKGNEEEVDVAERGVDLGAQTFSRHGWEASGKWEDLVPVRVRSWRNWLCVVIEKMAGNENVCSLESMC